MPRPMCAISAAASNSTNLHVSKHMSVLTPMNPNDDDLNWLRRRMARLARNGSDRAGKTLARPSWQAAVATALAKRLLRRCHPDLRGCACRRTAASRVLWVCVPLLPGSSSAHVSGATSVKVLAAQLVKYECGDLHTYRIFAYLFEPASVLV